MSKTTWVEDDEYGIRFPDGRIDWTVNRWWGNVVEKDYQEALQEQHDYARASQDLPQETLEFVTRKRRITTTVSETVLISDTIEEPEPPADDEPTDEGSANGTE